MEKYRFIEIKSIKNLGKSKESVYDLTVLNDSSYIANGLIVHNCGCITSTQSSIHRPMASLISDTADLKRENSGNCKIIADGGIKTYADIIKSLALGADYVMMGYALSKSFEAAGEKYGKERYYDGELEPDYEPSRFDMYFREGNLWKEYHGMSTKIAQAKILGIDLEKNRGSLKTSEGRREEIKIEYKLSGWLDNMGSYLRSAMSYTNCKTLPEFQSGNVRCQVVSDSSREKINNK